MIFRMKLNPGMTVEDVKDSFARYFNEENLEREV